MAGVLRAGGIAAVMRIETVEPAAEYATPGLFFGAGSMGARADRFVRIAIRCRIGQLVVRDGQHPGACGIGRDGVKHAQGGEDGGDQAQPPDSH